MKKTLFISVFQSFIARSILGTEAFRKVSANKGIFVVILCPDFKKDFYLKNFGAENVTAEGINDKGLRNLSVLQKIAILLLPTYFVRNSLRRKLMGRKYTNYLFGVLVNYVFAPFKIFHRIFRFFDRKFTQTILFDSLFEKYKPNLVFAPDIFSPADATLLFSARKHEVKSIGMVRSWDCPTNKNLLREIPANIAVNNNKIKEELVRLHDVDKNTITPVGFAQFDAYINMKPDSRELFISKIGADPNKRLVLFAPAGSDIIDVDWQYCDILDKAIKSGKIPQDIQFLVRKHPQDKTDLSTYSDNKNFIIEQPGIGFNNNARATEIDATAAKHLVNSLFHSDLVISVNTSLGLDAVVFDKPHIMLAFDGYEQRPFLKSIRSYHREDNMWGFIQTGAVEIANNPQELIGWINKYLKNPAIDSVGREKARDDILYKVDGKSGDRIADLVLKEL